MCMMFLYVEVIVCIMNFFVLKNVFKSYDYVYDVFICRNYCLCYEFFILKMFYG